MGCDIHATIENKEYDDWWGLCRDVHIDRNYNLFSYLADVRNGRDIKPISLPKGCPVDASYDFKEELEKWEGDAHSVSYLTFSELKKLSNELKVDLWYKFLKIAAKKYGGDNVRLCFFFDN